MSKYAVGFYDTYENALLIEIIEARNWQEAAAKHTKTIWSCTGPDDSVPNELEDAKREAFDADGGFDCVEIPA